MSLIIVTKVKIYENYRLFPPKYLKIENKYQFDGE